MPVWTFYDYVEESGSCPIQEWLQTLSDEAQAHIDNRLLAMEGLLRWSEKWISAYQSGGKLLELRIPFNKVQHRPLGMYAPGRSFILLAGAIEKGGELPKATVGAAIERQNVLLNRPELIKEPSRVRRHRIYSEPTMEKDAGERSR